MSGNDRTDRGLLRRLDLAGDPRSLDDLLAVRGQTRVLQEFLPVAEAIESELSRLHWRRAGVQPFVREGVPFVINNNGQASTAAASVLFASCAGAPDPEMPIFVQELGAGTGLFARYFLDAFRDLCLRHGENFYDRLIYVVTDGSPRTVEHWATVGLFDDHRPHVRLAICDALVPADVRDGRGGRLDVSARRAVFCNYVLDVLPAATVRCTTERCHELFVRTHLTADDSLLGQYTDLTFDELQHFVASGSEDEKARLIPLLGLLEFEGAFLPARREVELRSRGLIAEEGILNYAAMECLDRVVEILHPSGFALINDYGPIAAAPAPQFPASQRFGSTTAAAINYPVFEAWLGARGLDVVVPPGDEAQAIHARLVTLGQLPQTQAAFATSHAATARDFWNGPAAAAREHAAAGRISAAVAAYTRAILRNPLDWTLIGEAAELIADRMHDFDRGVELARRALALNPCYSPYLWNVLGDSLFSQGRLDDAQAAYEAASAIDPNDVRTNYNLSFTHFHTGRHAEALTALAAAMAADHDGAHRAQLLEKQQQVLIAVSGKWLGEQERLVMRERVLSANAETADGATAPSPPRATPPDSP